MNSMQHSGIQPGTSRRVDVLLSFIGLLRRRNEGLLANHFGFIVRTHFEQFCLFLSAMCLKLVYWTCARIVAPCSSLPACCGVHLSTAEALEFASPFDEALLLVTSAGIIEIEGLVTESLACHSSILLVTYRK